MRSSSFLLASFICSWSFEALAQTTNAEVSARANALYADANDDFVHERLERACAKYRQVLELQDTLGTHMQLATCYEKLGKLASSLAELEHVERVGSRPVSDEAQNKKNQDRVAQARERIAALEPRVPKLEVVVPSEVTALAGLKITRNGSLLFPAFWGKPIPVDMGAHEVEVRAAGRVPWVSRVKAETEGQTITVDVGVPQSLGGAPDENTVKRPSAMRIAGIVGIGLGALGVGVGAALGGVAYSKNAASQNGHCDARNVCDNIGKPLQLDAVTYGHAAAAVFVVSGVLVGTGVILVAASSPEKKKTSLWIGPGSISVRGVW